MSQFRLLADTVVSLAVVGIDMAAFFVVIRLLVMRWPTHLLLAFDRIGRPLADPLMDAAARAIPRGWLPLDACGTQAAAAVALFAITLVRAMFIAFLS